MTQLRPSKSRSDNPFLYMFNLCHGSRNYILYRIDALKHLRNKPSAAASTCNTQQLFNLQPLLVFPGPSLPDRCNCAKLGSMFYFLGESTDVYMIKESDLMDIDPNTNGDKYLIETASMNGPKIYPTTVFVAENKLYVLSSRHSKSNTQFEVFCPRLGTWKLLPPLPDGCEGSLISYVVVGKTVYFTISSSRTFLSFNLQVEEWVIVARDMPFSLPNYSFRDHLPPSPLVIIGGMAFGFLNAGLCDESLSICASPLPQDGDSVYYNFMRPSLAPDDEFMHAIDSSSCPHVFSTDYEIFSQYMVTLDGGQVLCVISYGNGSVPGDNCQLDFYTSYATLTFFEVTPGFYRDTCRCQTNFVYANEMDNGEYVATRHFKAKLLHSAQFIIKNASVHTSGRMIACFSQGL